MFAQWFVTACKTDKGFNMILVPKQEGVEVTPIKTSYSPAAGTAYVQFDNVKVPVDHLMGKEHDGFRGKFSNGTLNVFDTDLDESNYG
jgi:alkylation response protein AidB-like acyl-CoA dehydrogenase